MKLNKIVFYCLLFLISVSLISSVSAQCFITAEKITQTSITYNLTNATTIPSANLTSLFIDGLAITGYDIQAPYFISSSLKCDEYHYLKLTTDNPDCLNYSLGTSAKTTPCEQEGFFRFINQYIIIILVLVVYLIAIISEPIIGFIGVIIAFIGLATTVNYSFEIGSIFVILLIVGFFISVRDK